MFDQTLLVALLAVLFALNLTVALLARRRALEEGELRRPPERLDDGRLRCPECETANEPEYRFCRECVGELRRRAPTTPTRPTGGRSPFG